MSAYLVVNVEVTDPALYDEYRKLVPPTLEHYGGKYLARGGAAEAIEGDWPPNRVVIVEFPDRETAKRWWSSEEYREAKSMRQRAARTDMILVEGL